jgi:septal ring-binding cell division protein DamX
MPDAIQPAEPAGTSERRLHPRKPLWFPRIQLGDQNGGIILNISERGLAMMVVRSLADDPLRQMRFQLSDTSAWVETQGRIAWVSGSKTTAGVEFVDLPNEGHTRIMMWISPVQSSASVTSRPVEHSAVSPRLATLDAECAVSVPEPATTASVVADQDETVIVGNLIEVPPSPAETRVVETVSGAPATESTEAVATEKPGTNVFGKIDRPIAVLVLAALLLSTIVIFLTFRFRKLVSNQPADDVAVSTKGPGSPPRISVHPTTASARSNRPLNGPGFVLQVGAMIHKDNADALAESLRRRNFPAFVSWHETDRFYRVVVGPFDNPDSTSKVRAELSKQGFEAIRMPWNSFAQQ